MVEFRAVKSLIFYDNKYLILNQKIGNNFIWDLPGGKIKINESKIEALHREVKEEVSLEIKIIKPIGVYWFYRKSDSVKIICNTFLCTSNDNKIDLNNNPATENIINYKWIKKEEFKDYDFGNSNIKNILK
ncbi:NUDIX hydrolase [archaeon]|jgi:8-oxo-dGTP diphosphatase|nr:NUDIX hydrolase [archaeon]MBT4352785.1 NUDIX hydrolase [archaeon]MBT4647847.1 NUDIX hydrolase [archaeon]MBT6821048.1 NUDIX hydrolase [archaeon]MBT7392033.1 NUDIX hydrolase [archaeon]